MGGGFWEPHTSSIDFCEENYRFTPYVAELLNSVTSLPITASGIWSWALMPQPYRGYLRFKLCWLAFVVIGLGSALFHATLRRPMQALDEIPMVLANLVFVFSLVNPQRSQANLMMWALTGAGVLLVIVYMAFKAYAIFFLSYGLVVAYLVFGSARRVFFAPPSSNSAVLKLLFKLAFSLYFLGFGLWVTDHAACTRLGVGHLHIAWHFLAGGGTLVFVLLLVALTADADGISGGSGILLKWSGGVPIMPYLVFQEDSNSAGDGRHKAD